MPQHQSWQKDREYVAKNTESSCYYRKDIAIETGILLVVAEVVGFPIGGERLTHEAKDEQSSDEERCIGRQSGEDRVEPASTIGVLRHASVEEKNRRLGGTHADQE